jgi:hypothetical protein
MDWNIYKECHEIIYHLITFSLHFLRTMLDFRSEWSFPVFSIHVYSIQQAGRWNLYL